MKYFLYSIAKIIGFLSIIIIGALFSFYILDLKLSSSILLFVFFIILSIIYAYFINNALKIDKKADYAHGSARWMSDEEIENSNLINNDGVFLGKTDKYYLRHNGPEHVLVMAPTRSGKGVGLVIPTLLSWTESVIIHDIKGENWKISSPWRKKFSKCLYFNPTSKKTIKFNPLSEVRLGENEVRDVQNIADILVDPDGNSQKPNYWERSAHSILVAAILHVLYSSENKTLNGVANLLSDPKNDIKSVLQDMQNAQYINGGPHPIVASIASETLNKAKEEFSGVVSTALSYLGLYRDPVIANATNISDFKISDLMNSNEPYSLYLIVPPSDLNRTKPLMRMILNQMARILTEKEISHNDKSYNYKLLMMIDEFPSLGKLDFFETSLAYFAGYGIQCYLITQSLNQIDKIYGENNAILDNCHVRISFFSNDDKTAKRISDLLGTTTYQYEQYNHSGNSNNLLLNNTSHSKQKISRPLLTAGEVGTLPNTDQIIFIAGMNPIYAKKIIYYEDPNFADRF